MQGNEEFNEYINWLKSSNTFSIVIQDITMQRGLLAVQGPRAIDLLQNFTDLDLFSMKSYSFKILKFANFDNILISSMLFS